MAIQTTVKNQQIRVGDTIRVYQKIIEEGKTRSQAFEGVVISIKGSGTGKSLTVRKIASGNIGVERIWPLISPSITKVTRLKEGKVRRSKLYYLRGKIGKKATRIKSKEETISKETKSKKRTSAAKKSGKMG